MLLEATERVVAKEGFRRATTNRIAEVAGVSIGTLYHYFPTKEALVQGLVHRLWWGELEAAMRHVGAFDTAPFDEAIGEVVRALLAHVGSKRELYRAWYAEAAHLGDLDQGLGMMAEAIAAFRSILEARRSSLRVTDLEFAADFTIKTAVAMARTGARDYPDRIESGQLAREITDLLVRYLIP